jgi:hypothetical protein
VNTIWRKSSYSGQNGSCVEVALSATTVGIRDSKNVEFGQLAVTPAEWAAFVSTVKSR